MSDIVERLRDIERRRVPAPDICGEAAAEIERLRKERKMIMAAKELRYTPPPIPESFVINELQKSLLTLHAEIARLRMRENRGLDAAEAEIGRLRILVERAIEIVGIVPEGAWYDWVQIAQDEIAGA